MEKEQSLLLMIRHQLSVVGYSEDIIESQEPAIANFCKLLVESAEFELVRNEITNTEISNNTYKYYMYINNPADFPKPDHIDLTNPNAAAWFDSYKFSDRGIIFDTFETDSDWQIAVESRDIAALTAIYNEVVKFAKTRPVPLEIVRFIENTPKRIISRNWDNLMYNGIVDAYCDQSRDEYVVYNG